jgi:hypothetical protein
MQKEFMRNLNLVKDQLKIILMRNKSKLMTLKKLLILKKMPKKQKIQLSQLKMLNPQTLLLSSQRRLNQPKRKLKLSQKLQPLRLQRLKIKLLKNQKPPKQRLLSLPQIIKKRKPQLLKRMFKQRKPQLLKRMFKLKLMLKKVKVNLIQTLILTHLIPTVIENYIKQLL